MTPDQINQLERLSNLKTQGVLTEEEFQQQKSKIMGYPQHVAEIETDNAHQTLENINSDDPPLAAPINRNKAIAIVIGLLVVLFFFFRKANNVDSISASEAVSVDTSSTYNALSASPSDPAVPTAKWTFFDENDKMNGKEYYASISANDLLQFDFPYNGGSEATLTVRKRKGNTDIMLRVSKGQFNSTYDGGSVRIKFDNKTTATYSFSGASDASADVIFIDSVKKLISKMKTSKRMIIEAEFYSEGLRQMEFDIEGFKWDH